MLGNLERRPTEEGGKEKSVHGKERGIFPKEERRYNALKGDEAGLTDRQWTTVKGKEKVPTEVRVTHKGEQEEACGERGGVQLPPERKNRAS